MAALRHPLCLGICGRILALGLFLAGPFSLFGQTTAAAQAPAPRPSAQIDLSAMGFHKLSKGDRLNNEWDESLDFIDANHVLISFDRKQLFQRLPDCTPDHEDRVMRAVVVELPSGKVQSQAEWYLHDRRRYLWALGSGKFLLRRLDTLYLVDSSLHEEKLLSSPRKIIWVAVTPDQKEIIVETPETREGSAAEAAKPGFHVEFLDAQSLKVQRTVETTQEVDLDGTPAGYAELAHKNDVWLVRFGSSAGKRQNVARVRSLSTPEIIYPTDDTLLVARHSLTGNDYTVTAFTTGGRRLWRQRWNRFRYFPTIARSQTASRSAISSLFVKAQSGSSSLFSGDQADENHGLAQNIQIFETATGATVQSIDVDPVVISQQNFSLSADGLRLATLSGSALQLYDLPAPSADEQAKFAAFKADIPLYALAATSSADDEAAGESATVASNAAPELPPAPTTSPEEALDPTLPVFHAVTQAVVVDVVITDSRGKLIHGISQEDFHILEDGKPQALRSFHEFSEAKPEAPAASAAPAKSLSNTFTNDSHGVEASAVTIVLLDLLNTPTPDQQYARTELVKFLKNKPKEAQFALCTLTSVRGSTRSPLRLIQGFTSDETALLAAVNGKKGSTHAVTWRAAASALNDSASSVSTLAAANSRDDWQALLMGIQDLQSQERFIDTDTRVSITTDALSDLARYLSGIPGRKNLVWLSGSFPSSIFDVQSLDNHPNLENHSYSGRIRHATNLLAQAQVAIYPIDVRGLDAGDISAGTTGGMVPGNQAIQAAPTQIVNGALASGSGSLVTEPTAAFQQQGLQELETRQAEMEAINEVASDTGGKAFYNTNGITEAIATAMEQGSNYYTLSYTPTDKNYNGRFRKIKVELAQKGYHLHYRPGYFAEDPSAPARDKTLSHSIRFAAMQHGSPQSHQIVFSARIVPVGYKAKVDSARLGEILLASTKKPILPAQVEVQHYSIDFSIPVSALRFVPQQNGTIHSGLTFMFAAYDDDGVLLSAANSLGTTDLQPAAFQRLLAGDCKIHQEVDVPIKASFLRLGIQDQMNNNVGTLELPMPIAPAPDAPRSLAHTLPEIETE